MRARGLNVDIEDEGEVGPAIADGDGVQVPDHFLVEPARHALVNGGRIGEAIGDDDGAAVERGLNNLPNELAAARLEKEQLGLRRHRHALRRELQEMTDLFANRRPARLAGDQERHARVR